MSQEVRRIIRAYRGRVITRERATELLAEHGYGELRAAQLLDSEEEVRV